MNEWEKGLEWWKCYVCDRNRHRSKSFGCLYGIMSSSNMFIKAAIGSFFCWLEIFPKGNEIYTSATFAWIQTIYQAEIFIWLQHRETMTWWFFAACDINFNWIEWSHKFKEKWYPPKLRLYTQCNIQKSKHFARTLWISHEQFGNKRNCAKEPEFVGILCCSRVDIKSRADLSDRKRWNFNHRQKNLHLLLSTDVLTSSSYDSPHIRTSCAQKTSCVAVLVEHNGFHTILNWLCV